MKITCAVDEVGSLTADEIKTIFIIYSSQTVQYVEYVKEVTQHPITIARCRPYEEWLLESNLTSM